MDVSDIKNIIDQDYQKSMIGATPLFDNQDIENIVKGFVRAYLSGQIKISFPSMYELIKRPEYKSIFKTDWKKASQNELALKTMFNNYIGIVSGTIPSTQAEYEFIIKQIFGVILMMKAGERIEGKFYEYDVEERLDKIEKQHMANIELMKTEIRWLKDQLGV